LSAYADVLSRQEFPIFEGIRNLIPILLALVVLSSGCDCDGYSCNSEGCYAENNAQYLTLEDCLSVCDEITPTPESCGLVSHEGYDYSTVLIGAQCWFAENCRYLPDELQLLGFDSVFAADGTFLYLLPYAGITSPSNFGSQTDPYYYVFDYQGTDVASAMSTSNYATYGVLYNWPAVMTEDICPSGWHIPSDEEFTELTDFLGGESVAGYAMKSTSGWNDGGNGSNSSGFTGLPGGYRGPGGFGNIGRSGFWWSASESDSDSWARALHSFQGEADDPYDIIKNIPNDHVMRDFTHREHGYSARCVRD